MKSLPMLLIATLLVICGCGGDDRSSAGAGETPVADVAAERESPTSTPDEDGTPAVGTEIILANSEFGEMLFGADQQAIYIFEKDPKGNSVCYGECAAAWPPVYTEGEPVAGHGVRESLLGTVERRDGKLQVTYAGKPLYFYAHEGPGEVRCHDVSLNGGLWWVVGANGKRRP